MTRALAIALAITGCGGSSDSRPSLDPPIAARPAPIAGAVPTAPTAPTPDRQKKGAPPADTCYVDFLDIGTGLAVLVRCKDASSHELNLLYDGGSNDPALRSKNRLVYLLENGRVLSTKLNDTGAPACANNASKIAPMPAADTTPAGCNSIEFTIQKNAKGRKITSAVYWPIGPAIR